MELIGERHSVKWFKRKISSSDGSSCRPIIIFGDISLIRQAKESAVACDNFEKTSQYVLRLLNL